MIFHVLSLNPWVTFLHTDQDVPGSIPDFSLKQRIISCYLRAECSSPSSFSVFVSCYCIIYMYYYLSHPVACLLHTAQDVPSSITDFYRGVFSLMDNYFMLCTDWVFMPFLLSFLQMKSVHSAYHSSGECPRFLYVIHSNFLHYKSFAYKSLVAVG